MAVKSRRSRLTQPKKRRPKRPRRPEERCEHDVASRKADAVLGWSCMDCGKNTHASKEYYALKDTVWRRINPIILGMLCLKCAEDRLGRPLCRSDFSAAPINARGALRCPELADRLRRRRSSGESRVRATRSMQSECDLASTLANKRKTQSPLGRLSAEMREHARPDGRFSRKAFEQVILKMKSHKGAKSS
jgi:hypothetical protein